MLQVFSLRCTEYQPGMHMYHGLLISSGRVLTKGSQKAGLQRHAV